MLDFSPFLSIPSCASSLSSGLTSKIQILIIIHWAQTTLAATPRLNENPNCCREEYKIQLLTSSFASLDRELWSQVQQAFCWSQGIRSFWCGCPLEWYMPLLEMFFFFYFPLAPSILVRSGWEITSLKLLSPNTQTMGVPHLFSWTLFMSLSFHIPYSIWWCLSPLLLIPLHLSIQLSSC